jgi:hemin uptake protein HemP
MAVHIEEDQKLADKLPKTRDSYRKSRLVLFVLALVLNTVGGFILVNKVTPKADKSAVVMLDREHSQAVKTIQDNYKSALSSLASFDDQAAQSRATWQRYAQSRPNETNHANLNAKKESAALLSKKTKLTEQATAARTAELKAENAAYNQRRAAIISAMQSEINQQFGWEIVAAIGSFLFSLAMLTLVWIYHSRATRHELICGVSYTIQMPSNEEQNPIQTAEFLAKYIFFGISQTVTVGVYWIASRLLKYRLNFTGHGDTIEQRAAVKINTVNSAPAHAQHVEIEPEAPAPPVVEFEVQQGTPYSVDKVAEAERLELIKRQRAQAFTAANSANSANKENDNKENDNTALIDNKPPTTATAKDNNNVFSLAQFRAQQKEKAAQINSQDGAGSSQNIEIEFDHEPNTISQARAEKIKANKSKVIFEHDGQEYTIRDAEKRIGIYSKRAKDQTTSEEARRNNARTAELWETLVDKAINQQ